jgi:mRNA interferase MazF
MALSTVTVCPTSQSVIPASFRPEVELGGIRTHVLCEMAAAVDIHSVGERVGHLSHSELAAVDDGLRFVLGLP